MGGGRGRGGRRRGGGGRVGEKRVGKVACDGVKKGLERGRVGGGGGHRVHMPPFQD